MPLVIVGSSNEVWSTVWTQFPCFGSIPFCCWHERQVMDLFCWWVLCSCKVTWFTGSILHFAIVPRCYSVVFFSINRRWDTRNGAIISWLYLRVFSQCWILCLYVWREDTTDAGNWLACLLVMSSNKRGSTAKTIGLTSKCDHHAVLPTATATVFTS